MTSPSRHDPYHRGVRPQRVGLVLFAIYLALYAAFVYLNAFHHGLMAEQHAMGGVNVAVVYGFGLIVLPFVLALIYLALARDEKTGPEKGGRA